MQQDKYQQWRDNNGYSSEENSGDSKEPREANPDSLTEDDNIWFRMGLSDDAKDKLDFLRQILPTLSLGQKNLLYLLVNERKSLEETALILGMKKSTVRSQLNSIRKLIQKAYTTRGAS